MNFSIVSYMDRAITRLGYIKASDIPQSALALFAGEATPQSSFASYTEEVAQKLAITNPYAYANMQLIMNRIAIGIMKVEEQQSDGSWKENPDHAFTKIIEQKPNPFMGQAFIWEYQVFWLLLRGEMYWFLATDDSGELQQVYPLPANRVDPIPDPELFIRGYEYRGTATGKSELLDVEQVCYTRLPNPFNYHRGLSPLSPLTLSLQIDQAARMNDRDDYKNGLTLRHLISLRPEISNTDAVRYQRELDEGQKQKRRFLVTRGGDIDVKPLQNKKENESKDIRSLNQKDADYIFGIPEGLRALNATEANAEIAERTFANDTIWPLMSLLAEDMTVQIVTRYYKENERSIFNDIRLQNIDQKISIENHQRQVQTFDEARATQGLDSYYDPEIGIQKFTVADKLIELKYEALLTSEVIQSEENIQGKSLWTEIDYWRNGKNSIVDLEKRVG